ncbi:MAG: hypothetical protein ACKO11_05670 [Cuspidothrix sp.]
MSSLLFTELSIAQQETIVGGVKSVNINPTININTNIAVVVTIGKGNQINIGQGIKN